MFAIDSKAYGDHVVLAVRGEVDIATAGALRDHLTVAVTSGQPVVVDLAQAPFLDSTGLGVLVAAAKRARAGGTRLVVARPQRLVGNALRLVQADEVVDVYDTLDAAVAAAVTPSHERT